MSIDVEYRSDGLCVITINEPARRNPIGHAARVELIAALSQAEGDDV